jgi:CheY-like chemotaxis protein
MPARLAGLRILVVEDNPVHGEAVTLLLRKAAAAAEWAVNGGSALTKARVFRPDVVLIDQVLPDMTGADFWRAVKADPNLDGVAGVGFTALRDGPGSPCPLEALGLPVVRKPAGVDELADAIAAAAYRGRVVP